MLAERGGLRGERFDRLAAVFREYLLDDRFRWPGMDPAECEIVAANLTVLVIDSPREVAAALAVADREHLVIETFVAAGVACDRLHDLVAGACAVTANHAPRRRDGVREMFRRRPRGSVSAA